MMAQEAKPVTAAIREPEAAASLRREGNTRLEEKAVIREIPLQDSATLETELSALQRRQLRLAPEMDRCGEPEVSKDVLVTVMAPPAVQSSYHEVKDDPMDWEL